MQPHGATGFSAPSHTNGDVVFACEHCSSSLVVDAAAAGLTLPCQTCGKPIVVPNGATESIVTRKTSELQQQLKENESQRTEISSYINQHSIQLHRWQLRLKELNERQKKLEAELAAVGAIAVP